MRPPSRNIPLALSAAALFAAALGGTHAGTSAPPAAPMRDDQPARTEAPTPAPVEETVRSVVRVNSTNQPFQFTRPWSKRPPFTRRGIGAVIGESRVLVTAELVGDANYVELELPRGSAKVPAEVEFVDYDCNLAVVKPSDPEFLAGLPPVALSDGLRVGDRVDILQLEPNGAPAITPATITTVAVGAYPEDGVGLLLYKTSAPIQQRDSSFVLPAFYGDRLAGLLMRYDARSQTADIVPEPVIRAFLDRINEEAYLSFPRIGVSVAPTRDPRFRKFLGLDDDDGGIYISSVVPGGAGETASLQKGDVLLRVGPHDVDADGNYDHPDYGRISFSHYISTESKPGDALAVRVLRDGEPLDLEIPLIPRDPASVISPQRLRDQPPRYHVLGGFVFQELSRPFLREWGGDWQKNAPQRLVYLDMFQDELPRDRGKIVFLSQVLPSEATIGYEDLSGLVVEKLNGKTIRNLDDLAEAAKHPVDGYQRIELESDPGILILDAELIESEAEALRAGYGLPALQQLAPERL